MFYAYINSSKNLYYSTDGQSWQTKTFNVDDVITDICGAYGKLYILSRKYTLYVYDGQTLNVVLSNVYGPLSGSDKFLLGWTPDNNIISFDKNGGTLYFPCVNGYKNTCFIGNDGNIVYNYNTGTSNYTNIRTISVQNHPQTPSDAFINIQQKMQNIEFGNNYVYNELASMIRSGVESTLV